MVCMLGFDATRLYLLENNTRLSDLSPARLAALTELNNIQSVAVH